jgi:phosphoglycolate phosphatase-like HAD superfamily hydrolase
VISAGPRRLAVFDLDGTLTDTCDLDGECYAATLAEIFGLPADHASYDWSRFDDVSHTGIVRELLRNDGRDPSEGDLADFERAFVDRIAGALRRDSGRCRPVPGAVELVERLLEEPEWAVALATGCFRTSALLKLAHAGFDPFEVVRSGDDSPVRARIVESAVRGAEEAFSTAFESVVVLGDAVWDVAAAMELGLPCIGIGGGDRVDQFVAAGAVAVLPHFGDLGESLAALAKAALPVRDPA